jgi:hypothetical protein
MAEKQVNPRLIWTASVVLALLSGAIGVLLLVKPQQMGGPNASEQQLVLLRALGAAFCVGAFLVLVPRVAWLGALLLAVLLVGVIAWSIFGGRYSETIIPALFLVSATALAYIRRPRGPLTEAPKQAALPTNLPTEPAGSAGGGNPAAV